jgi:hypothetical protein
VLLKGQCQIVIVNGHVMFLQGEDVLVYVCVCVCVTLYKLYSSYNIVPLRLSCLLLLIPLHLNLLLFQVIHCQHFLLRTLDVYNPSHIRIAFLMSRCLPEKRSGQLKNSNYCGVVYE